MTTQKVYLIQGKRTPFGKFGGSLMDISPVDLAVYASKATLDSCGIKPEQIDSVILGNVVPSSTDTMYGGRHLALKLDCPLSTPGHVVNRLCGSGLQIMLEAKNMIQLNQAQCVLVAGTENMSMVPHLTYGSRFGTKYGSLKSVDMLLDALTDKFACISMGETAENLAQEYKISREQCDQFSLESHQKAKNAFQQGFFKDEIIDIELKRGVCSQDEHVRFDASMEGMAQLRPSFVKNGTVTPGTASGIVDGACALLIAGEKFCEMNGINPLAEIVDGHVVGVEPKTMGIGPVPAIQGLLEKNNLKITDIGLFEINEAFAAQTLACTKALNLDLAQLNNSGGAIAVGHPLAASGTRIALTLSRQLKNNKIDLGIASACIGGGQGISVLLKSMA